MSDKADRLRDEIITAMRDLAKASDGRAPGRLAFERATGIRELAWRGVLWSRWNEAVAEAGLAANSYNEAIDENLLMAKLAEAIRHFEQLPTYAQLRLYKRSRPDFPNDKTFGSRFKTKAAMLERVRDWALGRDGFEDLIEFLPDAPKADATAVSREKIGEGLVYLLRSSQHFKIGRSDQLERRVKEITIALPELVKLIHAIRTDDPAGIEAYWHRRFADRRANGEWFKLTLSDVAAFKRRKFQ